MQLLQLQHAGHRAGTADHVDARRPSTAAVDAGLIAAADAKVAAGGVADRDPGPQRHHAGPRPASDVLPTEPARSRPSPVRWAIAPVTPATCSRTTGGRPDEPGPCTSGCSARDPSPRLTVAGATRSRAGPSPSGTCSSRRTPPTWPPRPRGRSCSGERFRAVLDPLVRRRPDPHVQPGDPAAARLAGRGRTGRGRAGRHRRARVAAAAARATAAAGQLAAGRGRRPRRGLRPVDVRGRCGGGPAVPRDRRPRLVAGRPAGRCADDRDQPGRGRAPAAGGPGAGRSGPDPAPAPHCSPRGASSRRSPRCSCSPAGRARATSRSARPRC